jgi:hypothetical protein
MCRARFRIRPEVSAYLKQALALACRLDGKGIRRNRAA